MRVKTPARRAYDEAIERFTDHYCGDLPDEVSDLLYDVVRAAFHYGWDRATADMRHCLNSRIEEKEATWL